jgi:hypothetical protein
MMIRKDIQSYMRFTNFYQQYINTVTKVVKVLTDLKTEELKWKTFV